MWVYHSSIGNLYIVPLADGRYGFRYDGIVWESCHSPQAEADNVYCHATGCYDWDSCPEDGPTDLSEWEYLSE
jgi:hypothetical protein